MDDMMDAKSGKEMDRQQISTGPHKFELDSWISCAPFERLLHMKIIDALDGQATLTMPFLFDFAQGAGLMHGGALVSLADTAVVMAIKSLVSPQTHFATISAETKFLYPVKKGIITARARVTRQEERLLEGLATLFYAEDRPVLEFTSVLKSAKDRAVRDISFK
ncbi:MAG: PaaI family thioesterase, partial [Desulfobacterales bacterium]|nr:PaaI family thioesterase [Desulfobacterales bacterium]